MGGVSIPDQDDSPFGPVASDLGDKPHLAKRLRFPIPVSKGVVLLSLQPAPPLFFPSALHFPWFKEIQTCFYKGSLHFFTFSWTSNPK